MKFDISRQVFSASEEPLCMHIMSAGFKDSVYSKYPDNQ